MSENTFCMRFHRSGFLRYIFLSLIPSIWYVFVVFICISVGILPSKYLPGFSSFDGAVWLFIFLFAFLVVPRNHNIEVQNDALIERDHKGLHIRTVYANQIAYFHVNHLKETILYDIDNHKLLCIEHDMTCHDRFEKWLIGHQIKTK